mgnify:FL=1
MMNNKGQTLVIFVLILPLILLIISILFSYGNLLLTKKQIENNIVYTINYYFDHEYENKNESNMEEIKSKLKYIIEKNIKYVNLIIEIKDDSIDISIEKQINNLFVNKNIIINYYGYLFNSEKVIKRR